MYKFGDGKTYYGQWKNSQMHGYGEFLWNEGKKFYGFYKNDKKDGFGIYYWPNNKFYIGFWKYGKQNGIGKYIKDNSIKYGRWKDGQKENTILTEEEFFNCFNSFEANFINIFQWEKDRIKNFMKIN